MHMARLTLKVPKMKIFEFANSIYSDEVDHHEPLPVDLHFWPLVFKILIGYSFNESFCEILQT